jgi:hypothetical protein
VFTTGAATRRHEERPGGAIVMQDQPYIGSLGPCASGTAANVSPVPITPPGGMVPLRIFEDTRREIAAADTVEQVTRIRNRAIGLAAAARAATDREMEAEAAVLRLEAERKLGQLIAAQREAVGLNVGTAGQGRPKLGGFSDNPPKPDDRPTLAEAGIDKNLAHRARQAAAMSEQEFEAAVEAKREAAKQPAPQKVKAAESEAETEAAEDAAEEATERSKPRKRRTRSEIELEQTENLAFSCQIRLKGLVDLLNEQPEKFAAVLGHLAKDEYAIEALAALAREEKIKTLVAKVAPIDASSNGEGLSAVNVAELENLRVKVREVERLLDAAKHEIKDRDDEIARLRAAAPDDREVGVLRTRVNRLQTETDNLRGERLCMQGPLELYAELKRKLRKAPSDTKMALAVLEPKIQSFVRANGGGA